MKIVHYYYYYYYYISLILLLVLLMLLQSFIRTSYLTYTILKTIFRRLALSPCSGKTQSMGGGLFVGSLIHSQSSLVVMKSARKNEDTHEE
jgi:hypothetical protein